MVVEHVDGDLFAQTDLAALAHGVNTYGRMGAGIAPVFKRSFPGMFEEYVQRCEWGQLEVGGYHAWHATATPAFPHGMWVYNLASQQAPGPDARLSAVESSLRGALSHAVAHGVTSIGMPRIGCGIGGLAWRDVRAVVEDVAGPSPVLVRTVTLAP